MSVLKFYNLTHLGDAIFDSILLNKLDGDKILYMTHPRNWAHVQEWFAPHVELVEYVPTDAKEIWITHSIVGCQPGMEKFFPRRRPHPTPHIYNQVYLDHFKRICAEVGVACPFTSRDEICHTQPEMDSPGETWDWLLVNSQCLSNQLETWDEARMARIARSLPGKVITTHPVDGLPCTRTLAPSLFNVGQLAGRCRYVVGINTGPMAACLTRKMLDTVERFIAVDLLHGYEYGNGKACWCRNLDEFETALTNLCRPRRGSFATA